MLTEITSKYEFFPPDIPIYMVSHQCEFSYAFENPALEIMATLARQVYDSDIHLERQVTKILTVVHTRSS